MRRFDPWNWSPEVWLVWLALAVLWFVLWRIR